jgi:hypothetical protein
MVANIKRLKRRIIVRGNGGNNFGNGGIVGGNGGNSKGQKLFVRAIL